MLVGGAFGSHKIYEILCLTSHRSISMGVCCQNSDFHCHVGWPESWGVGYHSDDGGLFMDSNSSLATGPTWGEGDVVGCLVESIDAGRSVQFFLRGKAISKWLCIFSLTWEFLAPTDQAEHR